MKSVARMVNNYMDKQLNCDLCKNLFDVTYDQWKSKRSERKNRGKLFYCSKECRLTARNQEEAKEYKCTLCQKIVLRTVSELKKITNVFCSRSCAATYNGAAFPKRNIITLCNQAGCSNLIRKCGAALCETHWNESKFNRKYHDKTLGDYKSVHNSSERYRANIYVAIRKMGHSVLKHLSKSACFNCGYDKHRELCHIIPISTFPDTALISEINAESNVIPLCPNCHWEFDHGLMDNNIVGRWQHHIFNQKMVVGTGVDPEGV